MPPHLYESNTTEHGQISAQLSKSKRKEASELRKTLKPLMEKRRRARINDSLNQLKTLILPLIGKDSPRYSKLEKADILEMTVRFLQDLPKTPLYDRLDSYREGYRACLLQLANLLPSSKLMGTEACDRLTDYLERCMPLVSYYPYSHNTRSPTGTDASRERPRTLIQSNPTGSSALHRPSPPSHSLRPNQQIIPADQENSIWRPW
ncbi:transcription factor HES-2.1 [Hemiscyllium ocellatum]|uniref:transcription factor HES-2.1 n=1 Tax=Hemiscyllium ocellatum TaxID=170820 RepID=UPI0029674439|nr:transcription factor HES-2.1 [Hemiscyllium ocellatum]